MVQGGVERVEQLALDRIRQPAGDENTDGIGGHRYADLTIGVGGNIGDDLEAQLQSCWRAGVAAVEPGAAVLRALEASDPPGDRVHVLAVGKAAGPMTRSAIAWLAGQGRPLGSATAIVPDGTAVPKHPALDVRAGDHPVPGAASRRAADALGRAVRRIAPGEAALVLLSGGASSLVAAPIPGTTQQDLDALWRLLLGSGLDIHAMNAVRRRFTRWGGGRLAIALAGHPVDVLALSDVPGDDPSAIGSGPCSPDPRSPEQIARLLGDVGLLQRIPDRCRKLLLGADMAVATAGPDHPAFANVRTRIVASNADAVGAAATYAARLGWQVSARPGALAGEAAAAGIRLAGELLGVTAEGVTCIVEGGETTVALDSTTARQPPGGRCQELALAAARVLAGHGDGSRLGLLAAGTDGRDGPTDAAGAVVTGETWSRILAGNRRPDADLASHDSHASLDAGGALLRTGLTGTNVMDLVIGAARMGGRN